MDFDPQPYELAESLKIWLSVFGVSALLLGLLTAVALTVSHGKAGFQQWQGWLKSSVTDLFLVSPRHLYAVASLTFKEAFRRKALYVFVVFGLLFMFGGWFLSNKDQPAPDQVKVYVAFILRAISWLNLIVALLLACWGIPEDIRVRSIHTVVTKPVRRIEIVLGRILGYSAITTLTVVIMAVVGYVWIVRLLPAEAQSELTARQPIYGRISFTDRTGAPADKGINVGDIWDYRSYIEGATKARATWKFFNVTPAVLNADGELVLESRFQGFRSHKGKIGRELLFQYIFENPDKNLVVPVPPISIKEFRGVVTEIDRKLAAPGQEPGSTAKVYDIIDDLVAKDGTLTVHVACIDPGQYIGMARPDLFVRQPDQPFAVGFFKAVFGIELMLLLVIILGVTASTFVKGPVATLLTFSFVLVSVFGKSFMTEILGEKWTGGGLFVSFYRIVMHMNPTTDLPVNPATSIMVVADKALFGFLWLVQHILPDFRIFDMSPYIANGFDVRWDPALLASLCLTVGFFLPCVLLANSALQLRELEAK